MTVKLGDKVRDSISGFEGIATSRTEWLHGCIRIGVSATELKDGKPLESPVFDEAQLEVIGTTNMTKAEEPKGGPRRDPVRAADPQR